MIDIKESKFIMAVVTPAFLTLIAIKWIFRIVILDSFRGFYKIHELFKSSHIDDKEIKEMIDKFRDDNLEGGWDIVLSMKRTALIILIAVSSIIVPRDDPMYFKVAVMWPLQFVGVIMFDNFFHQFPKMREIWFIILEVWFGWNIITKNLSAKTYFFNESWIIFMIFSTFISILVCMSWRKVVLGFWGVSLFFVIAATETYDEVPLKLYLAFLFVAILFPMWCFFIAEKVKQIFVYMKINKDLIHTIRTILLLFPEGVIIRSIDPVTKETILKFANDAAKKFNLENLDKDHDLGIEVVLLNDSNTTTNFESSKPQNNPEPTVKLEEFLKFQEQQLCEQNNSNWIDQMIEIRCESLEPDSTSDTSITESLLYPLYFNVKSIKVNWDSNKDSFMHSFIDTSQVRKLEEVRATNKCQQTMFASVSHEFRTPINAFSNSLLLVKMKVDEIQQKLRELPGAYDKVSTSFQKIDKFIKIGEVSSKLLLVLVEDILDSAKVSEGKFKTNIDTFNIGEIVKEIEYIFEFQCVQKNLKFIVDWDPSIVSKNFSSDGKRIKQVLINLISNSMKFTEHGEIAVHVKICHMYGNRYLKFSVRDTGIGVKSKDIDKLFWMFSMISKGRRKYNPTGSGIGLSISKKIVESLSGLINVRSEYGKFTKFSFTIKDMSTDNLKELHKVS